MSNPQIERSNERGKFSPAELRAKVRESKAYWASPEGKAAAAKQEREKRNRKTSPARFPSLAGTKPAIVTPLAARKSLLNQIR